MIFIQSGKSRYALYQAIIAYNNNPRAIIYCKRGWMFDELLKHIPAENLKAMEDRPVEVVAIDFWEEECFG